MKNNVEVPSIIKKNISQIDQNRMEILNFSREYIYGPLHVITWHSYKTIVFDSSDESKYSAN
jgi:hypothetical protein